MNYLVAMNQAKALSAEIGTLFRATREQGGFRQDQIAAFAREVGLSWTRATIAAIETGRRELSLAEFLAVRGRPLEKGEIDGGRGLFWYAKRRAEGYPGRRKGPEALDAEIKAARKLKVEPSAIVAASRHL
jgi:transcriptional regulator with XRE-family HTH domain